MAKYRLPVIILIALLGAWPAARAQNYGDSQQGYAPPGQYTAPAYGQAPAYGGQPAYGQAPAYGAQPAYGAKPAYGAQPAYAPNPQYQPMPPMQAPTGGYAPVYPPAYQAAPQQQQPSPPNGAHPMSVAQWFTSYDQIRREAQMSPSERQRADSLMSRGLSILMPGPEKQATKMLLSSLVVRYQRAAQQLRALPVLKPTEQLHRGYYNYFASAGQLFGDYVRVQDNLLVTDAATGQPVASGLLQRKQLLEALEHQCKAIDAQTRAAYGIAAYPY